ncbi:hypothetical protein [Microbacterium sp. Se5.02b]|uniref:DUF7134 domain-containing protein n=1 Tax=Microbacterium sp. Se5.02b TaxID=2864103 RepID=UPI00215DA774|nr:hypothetical protein [Microbacterium sp. Se5.02b]
MIRPLSRTALTLDIVGAALLFLVLLPMSLVFYGPAVGNTATGGAAIAIVVIAGVLMFGGVAIGRLAPGLALAAAWVGAVLQMLAGFGPLPIDFAILLVLYATAAWGTRRVLWWGFGSALVGGLVAALYMVVFNGVAFGSGSGWEKVTAGTLLLVLGHGTRLRLGVRVALAGGAALTAHPRGPTAGRVPRR